MKLTYKLQLMFLGLGSLFAIVAGLGIVNFTRINYKVKTIYDDRLIPLVQLKSISDEYGLSVIDSVNKLDNGMITSQEALEILKTAQNRIQKNWSNYRKTRLILEEKQLADKAEKQFVLADRSIKELIKLLEENPPDLNQKISTYNGEVLYSVIDPIVNSILDLIELQVEVAGQERASVNSIVFQMWAILIPILVITLIFLIASRIFVSQAILSTLKNMIQAIATSSNQIAAASAEQEQMANVQAGSITKTTSTMDELGTSAQMSSQQANNASENAQKILRVSHQGNEAVERTLVGMSELQQQVMAIATAINQLTTKTQQIDNYQKIVSEIANQTNMLALNAAVEAVRAGEHGRGFTVVANEIRKLADESKQSANQINLLVNDIQTAIQDTVSVTKSGTQKVQESVHITQETAEIFQTMAESIEQIAMNSQQISLTSKQQATAIADVITVMNDLTKSAAQTTAGLNQTKQGTQALQEIASELQEIV